MFCQKCGTQNLDDATFCIKCGNNLKSIKPEIERKGITGKLGKMGILGFRSGKIWKMSMAFIGYFFIFMILLAIISPGNSDTSNSGTNAPSAPTLISRNVSDIGLTINDMPSGWMGSGSGNDTYYMSEFVKESYGNPLIDSTINKYEIIDDAKQNFIRMKNEYSDLKLESVGFGDESFAYEYGSESQVVFRKNNIIVETLYLKQFGTCKIRDAKEYAEIVLNKVK